MGGARERAGAAVAAETVLAHEVLPILFTMARPLYLLDSPFGKSLSGGWGVG